MHKANEVTNACNIDLEYKDFLKVLANKGYIEPAKILVGRASELEQQEAIKYYKIIIKGGYKYNVALANTILFNGSGYQDSDFKQPIKLINHNKNLSNEEIMEAMQNFREAVIHGENY